MRVAMRGNGPTRLGDWIGFIAMLDLGAPGTGYGQCITCAAESGASRNLHWAGVGGSFALLYVYHYWACIRLRCWAASMWPAMR